MTQQLPALAMGTGHPEYEEYCERYAEAIRSLMLPDYGNTVAFLGMKNPFMQFKLRIQTYIWFLDWIPAPSNTGPPSVNTPLTVSKRLY